MNRMSFRVIEGGRSDLHRVPLVVSSEPEDRAPCIGCWVAAGVIGWLACLGAAVLAYHVCVATGLVRP
jgi:hypothetical protein